MANGSPRPTAPAMPWEPTWLGSAPGPQLQPCSGNQHGRKQPRDHSSGHAPRTNMAGGSPGTTAPSMPREPTWPAAASVPQLPPCPENQHGRRQPQTHSSRRAIGTNMASGSPGPTVPAVPWERTLPAEALGPQLLPWRGNQHGRREPWSHSSRQAPGREMSAWQPHIHSTCHAPETNMAAGSPKPTTFSMNREPT